ncbi:MULTISPECIES: prepilin-type N-terminal cleavage/methylation domain-containing protein [Aliivibrio]|uniref:MSHA biogenesis protein MshA n=1 Tax=Aliivibrio logei TaxID=688 RepID=A0A1B9NWW8_ALILO|nr:MULTISPECIES: prepilin-type N-terminal cleavage/methylation domain-containing protein [Aliivibrio]MBB1313169.1 type II secretion system protein [Aliivibrio sp. SR45-2]OCH20217.1 MSHA biogenesis protein MshA [Aliivibrio logei]
MKRQGGFTLIELVVVIVILGILAVTAAPKFLNLQGDARKSSLQGLKGAMAGASGIVYGKAAIEGVEQSGTALKDGTTIAFGYPTADTAGIGSVVVGLSDDWLVVSGANVSTTNSISYTFKGQTVDSSWKWTSPAASDNAGCFVSYTKAESATSSATSTVVDNKC